VLRLPLEEGNKMYNLLVATLFPSGLTSTQPINLQGQIRVINFRSGYPVLLLITTNHFMNRKLSTAGIEQGLFIFAFVIKKID
jgi:hypothetical protein